MYVNRPITQFTVSDFAFLVCHVTTDKLAILYEKFIYLLSYPYRMVLETKLVNRIFSWRPFIDPLTKESIVAFAPRINALTTKISHLNEAYEKGDMQGVLSSYEVLLLLRCLEYDLQLKNRSDRPDCLITLHEKLRTEGLISGNYMYETFSSLTSIQSFIRFYSTLPLACFRGYPFGFSCFCYLNKIGNIRLFCSHFNQRTPKISFNKQEWDLICKMSGQHSSSMRQQDWVDFLNQFVPLLSDPQFLNKFKTFNQLTQFELFSIDGQLFSWDNIVSIHDKIDVSNTVWMELMVQISKRKELKKPVFEKESFTIGEMDTWNKCLTLMLPPTQEQNFPTQEEAEKLGISDEAKKFLASLPFEESPYWEGLRKLNKNSSIKEVYQILDQWEALPLSPLEWNRNQVELVYDFGVELAKLLNEETHNQKECVIIAWRKYIADCPNPLLKRIAQVVNQNTSFFDYLSDLKDLDKLSPMYCQHLSERPIEAIIKKVTKLNQLHREGRLDKVEKADKLTLGEYYWLDQSSNYFTEFYSEKTKQELDYYFKVLNVHDTKSFLNICFVNVNSSVKISKQIHFQKNGDFSNIFKKIIAISEFFIKNFLSYGPTNILYSSGTSFEKFSLFERGVKVERISGSLNPTIDSYYVNIEKLAENLKVPSHQKEEFKGLFENHFLYNVKSFQEDGPHLASPLPRVVKNLFSFKPFLKPEDFKLQRGQQLLCNELVLRAFVEASCSALSDLELPLPTSMRSFGFGFLDRMEGVTPQKLHQVFMDQGFLVPNKHVSAFVDMG